LDNTAAQALNHCINNQENTFAPWPDAARVLSNNPSARKTAMSNKRIRRREYIHLPALTRDDAIIACGGFFFEVEREDDKEAWRLLDDDSPPERVGRKRAIDAISEAYAQRCSLFLTDVGTGATQDAPVEAADHTVVRDLKPDTEYVLRSTRLVAGQSRRRS
jgi:hypothetical protein